MQAILHRPPKPVFMEFRVEIYVGVTKLTLSDSIGPIKRLSVDSVGV